ncbi:MAG TPA: magnesium and cobalt transport protein CorA [Stackebrandtia sp.]|uniref:magnesium and cobalt transport protein CorA n=1 Tax=Stackebrandtia sp. TaxID=2023065 RepID=UPI002D5205D9|nr:magnesium and cobalt transport protein CorA [Stackebrandtia sp.]HZE40496.1 magnesium and cobalt transport protein CorA [Stackebrandtia sp.]
MTTPHVVVCDASRPVELTEDLDSALEDLTRFGDHFLWVDLESPSQETFANATRRLGVSDVDFDEVTRHRSRQSATLVRGVLVVALKALHRATNEEGSALTSSQVLLFVTDKLVLSVHEGCADLFAEVRQQLRDRPECLKFGPHIIVQEVCDEIVATYDRIAHEIESDIIEVEHRVFDLHAADPLDDIYGLKREVLFFRRVEDPLHPVMSDLSRGRVPVPIGMRERFQQSLHDLDRVDNTIDSLSEQVTSVMQAHLAQVSIQQNTDMRKISSWAAIIAVPTLVAGVYGMNFTYMPELHWTIGYPLVVIVMLGACLFVYRLLKKNNWL